MTKIIGNNDGPGGRNEHYKIGKRTVTSAAAVKEVEQGKHPDAYVIEGDGRE